ncbi:MAG: PocR ligand-binding domain-containing protein [Oscillospiraceae bacterium]|jgi:ligand-binding sensor protein|nr:PocR ligand-binding domain-containing protein [Oscillospiraceae bacterium]
MKEFELSDVIDVKTLQTIQDAFSSATGMAALAVDLNHDVTKLSNPTDFCVKLTRGSKEGYRRCNSCDLKGGREAGQSHKPAVYYCHAGLMDFAAPIMVRGRQVGSLVGGQVLPEKPDPEKFRKIAREIGVDEEKYLEALSKVKIVPKKQIEAAAQLLYLIANTLSEIGYQKASLSEYLSHLIQSYRSLYEKVQEADRAARQVAEHVSSLHGSFAELLKSGEKIQGDLDKTGSIVKFIENLAMQTELLSFNASIVAAESPGTGFDVIAQELNTLSEDNAGKAKDAHTVLDSVSVSMQEMDAHASQTQKELIEDSDSIGKLQTCINEIHQIAEELNGLCKKLSEDKSEDSHTVVA